MRYPRHKASGQRQHTNPKARLRLWEAPDLADHIWCYRKEPGPGKRIYRQAIASATVLRSIWTAGDEERLNREVEQPAEAGLEQLVSGVAHRLSGPERRAVARYLVSLFRRGWQELAAQPDRVLPEVSRVTQMIAAASGLSPKAKQAVNAALKEQAECPPGMPFPIDEVSEVLSAMRWTILRCTVPSFATGDSPVQMVPDVIVDRECEVTLPFSPTCALVCDWGIPQPWTAVRTASASEVLEVNRRTALGANWFIYFPDRPREDDVQGLLRRQPRGRICRGEGGRRVPRKHRVTMELGARRILLEEIPAGNAALVEGLEEMEARGELMLDDGEAD